MAHFKLTPRDHRRVVSTYDNREVLTDQAILLPTVCLSYTQTDDFSLPFKDQATVVAKTTAVSYGQPRTITTSDYRPMAGEAGLEPTNA